MEEDYSAQSKNLLENATEALSGDECGSGIEGGDGGGDTTAATINDTSSMEQDEDESTYNQEGDQSMNETEEPEPEPEEDDRGDTPLLDDTDYNNDDESNTQRNENETPVSMSADNDQLRSVSRNSNNNDQQQDDVDESQSSSLIQSKNENSQDKSEAIDDDDKRQQQQQQSNENEDFEEININEEEKDKSSHHEETDALGEDRTQIISESSQDNGNTKTTPMEVDQSHGDQSISEDDHEKSKSKETGTKSKRSSNDDEEVTVERDNEESTEMNSNKSNEETSNQLLCEEQLEEGQFIEAAPNESEDICLLPDEEKELTGAEKERALQVCQQQAEKDAERQTDDDDGGGGGGDGSSSSSRRETRKTIDDEFSCQDKNATETRSSTPIEDETNIEEIEHEHIEGDAEENESIQHGETNDITELSSSTQLKEYEIKELNSNDENITEQKCNNCNEIKPGLYKLLLNNELTYLCDLNCVNKFRLSNEEQNYTLTCQRRIIITSILDINEKLCEICQTNKICKYRQKKSSNDDSTTTTTATDEDGGKEKEISYIYMCDEKCLNELIGKNVEKYHIRKKKYLVEELLKDVENVICVHCKETKSCKYTFKQDEDSLYICEDACYFLLSKEEPDRFRIKKRTVRVRDLGGNKLSSVTNQYDNEPKIVARTDAEAEQAKLERDGSFIRRCAQCLQPILTDNNSNNKRMLQWETMDFCNEICLGKYQNTVGSKCQSCRNSVPVPSLGKYCVRFGFEVHQFCCSNCLDCFKKGLKVCSLCQKDISKNKEGFLAPVGDKGQFKDFCSQDCLKRYEELNSTKKKLIQAQCAVCNNTKQVRVEIILDDRSHYFCSNPCFSAFKFVNNIIPDQCTCCSKYFERRNDTSFTIYQDNVAKIFCCKICMNLFIINSRRIVPCQWCKVKKYNFDMIQKQCGGQALMLCSLNCLTLYGVSLNAISMRQQKCDQCGCQATPQYHLTMSDATIRNFCTYQCVMRFQNQFGRTPLTLEGVAEKEADTSGSPFPTSLPKRIKQNVTAGTVQLSQTTKSAAAAASAGSVGGRSIPVISNVESLASHLLESNTSNSGSGKRPVRKVRIRTKADLSSETPLFELDSNLRTLMAVSCATQTKPPARRTVGTVTLDKSYNEPKTKIVTVPPVPPTTRNVITMCKPNSVNKTIMCRPNAVSVECQTEKNMYEKVIVPIPVPIYIPQPMYMYSAPFPVPVPIPLPIPVPIFIPTTRNSSAGILKEIKKIQDKMPSNPYEADLLMMAEMVAGEKKKEDTDSEDDGGVNNDDDFVTETGVEPSNAFGEDMLQMALKMATEYEEPAVDLESAMATNTITPSVHPHMQDDVGLSPHQMIMIDGQRQNVRGRKRVLPMDGSIQQTPTARNNRLQTTPPQKKRRNEVQQQHVINQQQQQIIEPVKQEPVEKPDANMCLKYTFGVNAWKQWVTTKNADIEKSTIKRRPFKSELLQMTADELNYSLCLFVKEVRKPNGSEYAPDTIYYLVLGIQQYLYENGRIDNIFTDPYYERFTDCLDEVAKKFSILYNDSQYIVTRVEEEHLWECKQLGAHSPHVLLSTLMFFNTKHFNLTTVDEHMQLSFSHIMKHWKRSTPGSKTPGSRNVLLRFYPPQSATETNPRKKKVYEQQENEENPLRCPVKLYEFYLSKCPESVKTRNDVFYLQPERSCVPDSPVWYSTQPLSREALSKMLHRVKMVKEINIALLTS